MHFIQLDIPNNGGLDSPFAFQIRTAYLLSDVSNIIGTSTFLITFDHVVKNLTVPQLCELVMRDSDKQDPVLIKIIDAYAEMGKQLKEMKHAPTKLFIAYKSFENTLRKALNSWTDGVADHVKKTGYKGIFELYEENSFVFYHPSISIPITNNTHIDILQVLRNKAPMNAINTSIWLMPLTFYTTNIYDCDAITELNLIEENKPYLIKCLTLSNQLFASTTELTAIKHQLENEIIPFKTAMEEWAIACNKETNGIDCFKNKVFPTIAQTQRTLDNNTLLKHLQVIDAGKISISLYMGEVPPPTLWKYYKDSGMLNEDEFATLVEEYKASLPYTVPVILFIPDDSPFQRYNLTEKQEEIERNELNEVLIPKKSIMID